MSNTVQLHFTVVREPEMLTAICDELPGLVTCAPTMERLSTPMIPDAICGWFDALVKLGRFEEVCRELHADPSAEIHFSWALRAQDDRINYVPRAA